MFASRAFSIKNISVKTLICSQDPLQRAIKACINRPAVSPGSFFFFYFISVITADSGGAEPWRRFPRVRVVSDLKGQCQRQHVGHCSPGREGIHQCQFQHRSEGNKLKNRFRRKAETHRTFDIQPNLNVTLFPSCLL